MTKRKYYSMLKDYPEVLTVAETAKVLRIGRNKAYEIIKKGKISAIKLSGKILVPKTSLVTFLMGEKTVKFPELPQKSLDFHKIMCYCKLADGGMVQIKK